jgi:hypothetical protein
MELDVRRYHGATPAQPPVIKAEENCISSNGLLNIQLPVPKDESKGESTS